MNRLAALALALTIGNLFAQSVDEDELRRRDLNNIVFRNYVGPVMVINTAQEIRGIGFALAAGVQNRERFTYAGKYSVIRVFQPEDPKLSADIIVLEPAARVDHINGLNLIVSAYLERTFNYTREDARVLANFVTRYNALFRGNMDFFRNTYAAGVVQNLSAENAGLSTFYQEWPGRSRIVIPLRSSLSAGPRGLIDSDEVSRPEVTRAMPPTPENLQERREIVNIREREIQREEQAIQQREEQLRQQQTQQAPNQTPPNAQQQAQQTPPGQQPAQADRQNPQAPQNQSGQNQPPPNRDDQQGRQPQQNAQQTPAGQQPAATQQSPEQQELQRAREQLQQREENLQRDRQEIQQQEQQIAQAPQQRPAERERVDPVLFLSVDNDPNAAQFLMLDAAGRRRLARSDLNSIRGRKYVDLPDGFLVIAGREGGDAAVRLVVVDKERLGVLRTGTHDIHPDSDLQAQGQNVYAVFRDGNTTRLGLFNPALELVRRTEATVRPQTVIQIQGQRLLVQGTDGRVLFLNPTTLESILEVRP